MATKQPAQPLQRRWIGGANLPTTGGLRVNAGFSFAELLVSAESVSLRLRGPLSKVTRAEVLIAKHGDIESVFPIRPKRPLGFRGVGFRGTNGHDYYFKTTKTDEVLNALRQFGYPLSSEARPATKIWRAEP